MTVAAVIAAAEDSGGSSPTSNKGSGGCDAGLGALTLLVVTALFMRKRS